MTNCIKIDLDIKPNKEWRKLWINTRKLILKHMKLHLLYYREYESRKGYHYYFIVKENLSYDRLCKIQFLLGDDINRVRFMLIRKAFMSRLEYNVLFSEKYFKIGRSLYKFNVAEKKIEKVGWGKLWKEKQK